MKEEERVICERWLKVNAFFGRIIGVWPYQQKQRKIFIRIFQIIFLGIGLFTMTASTVVFFSFTTLMDNIPYFILALGFFLKQFNYICMESTLRGLIGEILHDLSSGRPKEELDILETHSSRSIFFISVYKAAIYLCVVMFSSQPLVPMVLDIVLPLNVSRERAFVYPCYYFSLDIDRYYYYVILHMVILTCFIGCCFIACDSNIVIVVQHACALMAISGLRFKNVMKDMNSKEKNSCKLRDESHRTVSNCIAAHQKAIRYIKRIEHCHVHSFLIAIGLVILSFTITFVKVASMEMSMIFFTMCAFTIGQLVHLFFLTLMGQFLVDSNDEFYDLVGEGNWYDCTPKTQLLYVMVMQKCLTPTKLTAGRVVHLNLDTFVQIIKMSVSYYTVLKST